jgi:hypothetical protein
MKPLEDVLVKLSEVPLAVVQPRTGEGLGIEAMRLDVPIEAVISEGRLAVSLPRGRLATGFDRPQGRLMAFFEWSEVQ